jgi:hypothetical protein
MKSSEYYLKAINNKNLATTKFYCPVVKATSQINKTDNIVILHTFIDYNIIFRNDGSFDDSQFKRMWTAFYNENMEEYEGYFIETLNYFTNMNKTVIVYIDFMNYLINYEALDEKGTLEYLCHSTVSIYYPSDKNKYNVFHFNSHGNATKKCPWEYKKYITRKRYKTIKLNAPLDYFVFDKFISVINKHPSTEIHYEYKKTDKYNYMGPNMQQGDNKGICFTFPFLISYYIIKNYRNTNYINNIDSNTPQRMTSFCKMMIKGNINQIIYIIMGAYLHDFNELVYNDSDEDIENITDIICRKGGHLVRSLLHDFTKLVK